jgi:glycerophosphoryl diester phosphodiesterase
MLGGTGDPIGRAARLSCLVAMLCAGALTLPASAAAGPTDWTQLRGLNITHQGGEDEAPSATMYALERSLRLGGDMLEVDVHTSADGDLMVIHDGTVDRTTNGSGSIYEMTTAEIQALDAGHNFVPGEGSRKDRPESDYPFRGVRLGKKKPPPAFDADDFRIPTLPEVLEAYPKVPVNIEIKGASDEDVDSYFRNADALAAYLNRLGRTRGIVVASFNDAAIQRFHKAAPQIDTAASTTAVAAYKLAGVQPPPGTEVFQVPIEFSGITVTDEAFIDQAHADGLGVHVWTINDEETMRQLLGWGVDGIMTAEPARLEKVLCRDGVSRPDRPASYPGEHCSKRVSIACDVEPTSVVRKGRRRAKITLERRDDFDSRCAGRVALKGIGVKSRRKGRFNFTWKRPSEGGPTTREVKVRLSRKLRRSIRSKRRVRVTVHPYGAFVDKSRMRVTRGT